MNRRRLLVTLGVGLGGVGGCLTGEPGESTETPTDSGPSATPTSTGTADGSSVVVEDIVVEKSVRYSSTMGSGGVLADADRQYVVATLSGADRYNPPAFVLETDTGTFESGLSDTAGARNSSVAGRDRPYVAFELPSPLSVSNPRIQRPGTGTEWSLSEADRETLAAPAPRYELDELTVPERVSQGEPMTVELTATNVAETDGRFLAAVYWPTERIADDDESHVIDRTVAAGDAVTATLDIDTAYTTGESGPVTLSVAGHVAASREIQVNKDDGEQATESPP